MVRWSLVGLVLCLACEGADARECLPGDFLECTCDDGLPGYAVCDDEGTRYSDCGFCGQELTGGAGGAGGASGGGGDGGGSLLLPFMSECEEDAECETGMCHPFNAKGPHCSHTCSMDADCESPSPGCNMMGVCKAP